MLSCNFYLFKILYNFISISAAAWSNKLFIDHPLAVSHHLSLKYHSHTGTVPNDWYLYFFLIDRLFHIFHKFLLKYFITAYTLPLQEIYHILMKHDVSKVILCLFFLVAILSFFSESSTSTFKHKMVVVLNTASFTEVSSFLFFKNKFFHVL